jgi:hypothetical protein
VSGRREGRWRNAFQVKIEDVHPVGLGNAVLTGEFLVLRHA